MVYQWKQISYSVPAQVAGEELERIENKYGGIVPSVVVAESKEETSPLHKIFEWDNDKAGEKWREQQARVLIGNIVTVHITKDNDELAVRSFVNVTTNVAPDVNAYVSVTKALSNADYRQQIVEQAKVEFLSFKKKYSNLKEFFTVFKEFEKVFPSVSA
jgi:hypothetical protein